MSHAYDDELAPWVAAFPAYDFSDLPALRLAQEQINDNMEPYEAPVPLKVTETVVPGDPDVPVWAAST